MADGSARNIEAVLFDFGLVLSRGPEPSAWRRMLDVTGIPEGAFQTAYWKHRHDYDRGLLTGPAYWRAVAEQGSAAVSEQQVTELIRADTDLWTDMNVPMVAWAQRLQRAGVKTGILSNIGDSIADGIKARLPWLGAFTHCTWSHEWRMAKPEPAIYLKTAEALGVHPSRILFIDDRAENIAGGNAVGMYGVQYSGQTQFEDQMRSTGFGELLHLGQFADEHAPSLR